MSASCPTPGCPGDANYAAPGRLHRVECTYPNVADLIDHELNEDCVCGPAVEAVMLDDGSNGWVYTHHSLDGREMADTGSDTGPDTNRAQVSGSVCTCGKRYYCPTHGWL